MFLKFHLCLKLQRQGFSPNVFSSTYAVKKEFAFFAKKTQNNLIMYGTTFVNSFFCGTAQDLGPHYYLL